MKRLSWLMVFLWALIIFYFSHRAGSNIPAPVNCYWFFRKSMHFAEYFVLSFLLLKALGKHRMSMNLTIGLSILIALIYALSDEFHQTFVPARDGNVRDVMIDSLGILSAAWLGIRNVIKWH